MGNSVARRGLAKHKGGVGRKITGITRRQFRPNLQRIRVQTAGGSAKRMWVCTQCMRSGRINKPTHAPAVHPAPERVPEPVEADVAVEVADDETLESDDDASDTADESEPETDR